MRFQKLADHDQYTQFPKLGFSPGVSPSSLAAGSSRLLTDEVISSNKGLILMSPMFCELWVLVVKLWSTDYSRGGLSLVFAVLSHNLAIEQMHGPVGVP